MKFNISRIGPDSDRTVRNANSKFEILEDPDPSLLEVLGLASKATQHLSLDSDRPIRI